ncbi:MAG: MarR family transcriptional regulator [Anaerolineae bacterium]|nr:MarR family transcriptional regulator [Anaerolineae bacterium]
MLQQLLRIVAESDVQSVRTLAEALDLTPGLVEGMLEQLVREGYLERQTIGCEPSACEHCAYRGYCSSEGRSVGVRGWRLTESGKRVAGRI